ncbi:hypothetical protein PR202_gb22565 [Eleusine coracana subsp. coracana]|uniref:Uncharacterized protein n=1 Tax=Eleusine coracana subsp. coracana TaxID=191504 RepID=A0AAV5FGN3_ELECO|nr:hypothetical protein PR202_gb22565 [Eleusine coracana subsp. coracana]
MMLLNHRSLDSGRKKTNVSLLLLFLYGTTIATPDSVYGRVKSTYEVLLELIDMSPIAISYF